jgi:hypothetical protein
VKGLTHFTVGVAAASFFPAAVRAGAAGNPLYFVLGGVAGLLPDTIDFRFVRLFYRHDVEVVPDPGAPDPRLIAEAVAWAVGEASAGGRPVRIRLNTSRAGPNLWHRYQLRFDIPAQRVAVRYEGLVRTDRSPLPGAGMPSREASAPLPCPVVVDYQATTPVDIFDGPVFAMEPAPGGRVVARFVPWHRRWSHSLAATALLAAAGAAIWGPLAGAVILAAHAGHLAADQLGFMGSCLFLPFRRPRVPGLHLTRSDSAFANFAAIWMCGLLGFWNLARLTPAAGHVVSLVHLLAYGGLAPLLAARGLSRWLTRRQR